MPARTTRALLFSEAIPYPYERFHFLGAGMGLRSAIFLGVIGLAVSIGVSAVGRPFPQSMADNEIAALTDTLTRSGSAGTLTAPAAEMFGLPYRDYSEKYMAVTKPDGTLRMIEVVPDETGTHIFFSHRTTAEMITVRSGADGEFVTGLQRETDSTAIQELSGNQGRAFLQTETAYWLVWLADKSE